MNWDQVAGNWKQFKGKAKEKWGDLTDDELMQSEGQRDRIYGLLQKRYGYAQEQAQRELDSFIHSLD